MIRFGPLQLARARRFTDLRSVGPATLKDFALLGIRSVPELAHQNPAAMYEELCLLTGQRHDPCALDVFACAVAQARNPKLPEAQRNWWYWSRRRKATVRGHADVKLPRKSATIPHREK